MSSQYEKRQIAKLNELNKKRKLRKTRQKLGYKDDKENEPVEEEADGWKDGRTGGQINAVFYRIWSSRS